MRPAARRGPGAARKTAARPPGSLPTPTRAPQRSAKARASARLSYPRPPRAESPPAEGEPRPTVAPGTWRSCGLLGRRALGEPPAQRHVSTVSAQLDRAGRAPGDHGRFSERMSVHLGQDQRFLLIL